MHSAHNLKFNTKMNEAIMDILMDAKMFCYMLSIYVRML